MWSSRRQPPPQTVEQRLAALPVRGLPVEAPVEIRWNAHLVPYLDARSDRDLAVALGLVHAHLRLAQIELLRRAAEGRLAETFGPIAVGLDHALRLLDPGRAVPAILAGLPATTRDWIDGFVAGINHRIAADRAPPLEFQALGIAAAPWTAADVLRLARLLAADVNWLVWIRLLRLPRGPGWRRLWEAMLAAEEPPEAALERGDDAILFGARPSGSNAVAVAGSRSATGFPWIAGDPHLPLTLPGAWLCAAWRSPSYAVAGLMFPGVPAVVLGRNRQIAWGGTSLHAASSELFDAGGLPPEAIRERRVRLEVRWGRDRDLVLRDSDLGPIVSDVAALRDNRRGPLGLRWVGHEPSDEIGGLLAICRAQDWGSFRRAAAMIAVPAQTVVYADRAGRIGRCLAVRVPRRPPAPPEDLVSPPEAVAAWAELIGGEALPSECDPPSGFFVSANEAPPPAAVPVGWFFSPPDRAARLAALIGSGGALRREDFAAMQQDVFAAGALELRDRLLAAAPAGDPSVVAALARWDGTYAADSAGALAFELVLRDAARRLIPAPRLAAYEPLWNTRRMIARELASAPAAALREAVDGAIRRAAPALRRFGDWGGVHRLRLRHPMARLPGAGRSYRFGDWPVAGSNETILKTGHGPVAGPHAVVDGANARYLFDLSDPDGTWLVLLGGQDGAIGSAAFDDQIALFRSGAAIQVPLTPEAARGAFPLVTRIEP